MNTRAKTPGPVRRFGGGRFLLLADRCLEVVLRAWLPDDRDRVFFDEFAEEPRDPGGEDVRVAMAAA